VANLVGFPRDVTSRADFILKGLEKEGCDDGGVVTDVSSAV